MAPPGKSNLYVELATRKPLNLESLMPHIAQGLLDMGIIKNRAHIESVKARRITHGYVVYNHTYSKDVSSLLTWLENKRIFSAGRYAKWEYSAMEDALFQGIEAADKVRKLDS
jgi:protoporphyrinogen oxidase